MTERTRSARTANLPLRARKRNISYREPSSDVDIDDESFEPSSTTHLLRSSSKRRRTADDDDETSKSEDEITSDGLVQSRAAPSRSNPRRADGKLLSVRAHRKTKPQRTALSRPVRGPLGVKRASNTEKKCESRENAEAQRLDTLQLSGKVPPWHSLPYEILLQIFQYASYPLVTESFQPSPSLASGWLLKWALLCKGFAEPALSALYYAPPLCSPFRAHKLLASLRRQNERSFLNYRAKIKYLDVEADEVLCRKYEGREPVELGELLSIIPQVRAVRINLLSDQPVYGKMSRLFHRIPSKRRPYQPGLFSALIDNNIRLSEWTWNGLLMLRSHIPITALVNYHKWEGFKTLRHLTFFNFDRRYEIKMVALSTSNLRYLRSLKFIGAEIQCMEDLEGFSKSLEALEFTSCASLDSLSLTQFLISHGGNLRELILDHNNALDLSFLEDLAISCPRLERLKMDLRFFNTHVTFNDLEPKFSSLLQDAIVPTWPRTLQRIELFHLRKWETSAADTFFSSLVYTAKGLPDLRHIEIKASIGESNWRDRISFRNKWISRMEKVFKRVSAPPDPRLRSISTFNAHKQEFRRSGTTAGYDSKMMRDNNGNGNQFSHVQVGTSCGNDASGDSDVPLASKRRSTRLKDRSDERSDDAPILRPSRKRRKRKRTAGEDSSSEEDSALEDLETTEGSQHSQEDDGKDIYIQGLCDVVRVSIDNLRPTEEHLDESNFLDDEISGDEDWDGDDEVRGGGGYAW
ncbi:MAG: hypothetical protein Q9225_006348 [Loekoesia sp. 1 TL-2023]